MPETTTATAITHHRLDGLEPDNLLAFLALLGLLRALGEDDRNRDASTRTQPRAMWDPAALPLRPVLVTVPVLERGDLLQRVAAGLDRLVLHHDFGGERDLAYTREDCRAMLTREVERSGAHDRYRADLLAALMSDGALKDAKDSVIAPTPLCLLFGQGHQHFLERLAAVPRAAAPPPRGGRRSTAMTPEECLEEALFTSWRRADPTPSFRWDPEEDVRYALLPGDPTDAAYKQGTQHGANRLAAAGISALTVAPRLYGRRIRPAAIGGDFRGRFAFAWPIWSEPATLAAIRAMLSHPGLHEPGGLAHLGVTWVYRAQRISVGKFMNFSRARPISKPASDGRGPGEAD